VITANGARSTVRGDGYVTIGLASGEQRRFDAALIATHADDALALLGDADARERRLLGAFGYQANEAVLHVDPRLMPQRRRVWSSWNYVEAVNAPPTAGPQVTYWMNRLQPLACREDVFVTLNPVEAIAAHHIRGRFGYAHPVFDAAAMAAQRELWSLQGRRGTGFAGSYFGYGFHEDGLQAGLAAAEHLGGVRRPWVVANESGRIHIASPAPDGMALAEAAE
jgi:predicted NAD/FAD-binding protein